MDITETLAPKSDQLDAIELASSGPRTFTVERTSKGNAEQPVQVHLVELDRVWRPGKNMRRVLGWFWGTESSEWPGRRITLYCDPTVKFGKDTPGGTRISQMSALIRTDPCPLILTRGTTGFWSVEELPELSRREQLRAEWDTADPERREAIRAEVAALEVEA